jgi:hypothetical protein
MAEKMQWDLQYESRWEVPIPQLRQKPQSIACHQVTLLSQIHLEYVSLSPSKPLCLVHFSLWLYANLFVSISVASMFSSNTLTSGIIHS